MGTCPMKLGPYRLGQQLQELAHLLSPMPASAWAVLPRAFVDEALWEGQSIEFAGRTWGVMVASTRGAVYKIILDRQFPSGPSQSEIRSLFREVKAYWQDSLGTPSVDNPMHVIWDTSWGNVILDERHDSAGCSVMVFLTSNAPFAGWSKRRSLVYRLKSAFRLLLNRTLRR